MKIYFDFDRTIFDTHLFYRTFWRKAEQIYKVDSDNAMSYAKEYYYPHQSGLEWYDFHKHATSYGLDTQGVNAVLESMKGLSFIYTDVSASLRYAASKYPVEILTFGDEEHQKLKLSFESQLAPYTFHIVQQHKKEYLAELTHHSVLIDDKDLADQLPGSTIFIRIDREAHTPLVMHSSEYYTINTLFGLKNIF